MDIKSEIRDFLTSRRGRITPEEAGLKSFGQHRVPGLRREEVATLAGLSVEYYNRLERGNLGGASDTVLDALADALRLDEAERAHLFDLARASQPAARGRRAATPPRVRPPVQWLLDSMTTAAAFAENGRLDALGANQLGRALYPALFRNGPQPGNWARFIFLNRESRSIYADWDRAARDTVALLRLEAGRNPHDRELTDLIGELATNSEEFGALCRAQRPAAHQGRQDVEPPDRRRAGAQLRAARGDGRLRPDDCRLHGRAGIAVGAVARSPRKLGSDRSRGSCFERSRRPAGRREYEQLDHLSMREVVFRRRHVVIPRSDQSIEEVDVIQQGQVFKLKARGADGRTLWAYRYRLDGRGSARPQVGGFASRAEAEDALRKALARLRPGGCAATMTLADLVEEYLNVHQGEPVTIAKLRWLLGKATSTLGPVRLADLSARDIYAWRQTIPEGHRFEATQALRQVLRRAVEWEWLSDNPAKRVPNPQRRAKEKRPFESWEEIEAVAAQLKPLYGAMVVFAAATGLRPSELFGLERRDVDREAGVVYVRRAFANGRLKQTKTRLSNRAVPLQAKALEAIDQLPPAVNPILFANTRGGRIDFRSFGRRHWKPAQRRAGVDPLRGLYDLRHTYATFALRAGVPVFAVSRFMGSSIAMIDYHYGHLAHDSREHAVSLLDALAFERAVDAGWTPPPKSPTPVAATVSRHPPSRSRRTVDARWTSRRRLVVPVVNERS